MARLIKVDGTESDVTGTGKKGKFTLKEMQALVGGYIEVVRLGGGAMMVVDEEGWIKDKPLNQKATMICAAFGRTSSIAGDVIIMEYPREID